MFCNDNFELLVMRLEDLTRCGERAIGEFLGLGSFVLRSANVGDEKRHAAVYRQFKESIVLPQWYTDRMYDSRFARHFYSEQEIGGFRRKWSRMEG